MTKIQRCVAVQLNGQMFIGDIMLNPPKSDDDCFEKNSVNAVELFEEVLKLRQFKQMVHIMRICHQQRK